MHHHRFYAVKNLEDAQAEEQISTLFLRLNDKGLMGRICRARIIALQKSSDMGTLPTKDPGSVRRFKHNFASGVCELMAERNIKFDLQLANDFGLPNNTTTIEQAFGEELDDGTKKELGKRGIYFVDQLMTHDTSLKSWKEVRVKRKDPKQSPAWFNNLQNVFHQTEYTQDYVEQWCNDKIERLQEMDVEENMEGHESYLSDVEGETEDEEAAVDEVYAQFNELEDRPRSFCLRQEAPKQFPVEEPGEREQRKRTYIQEGMQQSDTAHLAQREEEMEALATAFERNEFRKEKEWEANERSRLWVREKDFQQLVREDAKVKGPIWRAKQAKLRRDSKVKEVQKRIRDKNRERCRQQLEAERRRTKRRAQWRREMTQRTRRRAKAWSGLHRKIRGLDGRALEEHLRTLALKSMDSLPTARNRALPMDTQQGLSDTFGIYIPEESLGYMYTQRDRLQGRDSVTLYSDGSMENAGKRSVRMALGVVVQEEMDRFPTVIAGRVDGFASSTKAELAGLFAAITVSPRNTPTTIYIDNSAVVSQFRKMVRRREACTERQRLRSPYAVWWAAVHNAYNAQGRKVNVIWVRGHAGNKGNEAADKAAKDGHLGELWSIKEQEHNDLMCHALFNNKLVEDDLRQLLKQQSVVRTNAVWSKQNRTEKYIPRWQEVDWKVTLHIIHNGNTPRGLFTSPADCRKRAHKIKKMHGMLPTLSYMKQWRPDLYETDICRMCELEREDTEHLWRCPITDDTQLDGWKKALENIQTDGKRALAKERKIWLEQQDQARKHGQTHGGCGPQFTPAPEATIWRMLQTKFQGVTAIRKADRAYAEQVMDGLGDDATWSVQDLYHGLTPKDFVQECKRTFKTSMSIARYVAGRFVKAIEKVGRSMIWNRRCKCTVEWEREHGITSVSKRARGRNCVGQHRRSRNDFMGSTLRQRTAEEVKEIKTDADRRVEQSYFQQVELTAMERLGSCKFLMTTDRG